MSTGPVAGSVAEAERAARDTGPVGPLLHSFSRPAAPPASFVRIVAGAGTQVVDDAGRRYLDATAGLWYCAVGHGRTEIIDAIARQLRTLDVYPTFGGFTNPPAEDLAARLTALAPMPNARVFFTNSGSEAVDASVKLARQAQRLAGAPDRTIVISRTPSYHGSTFGGTTLTGMPASHEGFGPLVGDVVHVDKDDLAAVEALMAANPGRVAAVIAEPVIGAAGLYPPAPGYLPGLRTLCDRYGAFLILDEVVTGFGRLGSWFGATRYGVRPDLVAFAKAVTSGYLPLGGVLIGAAVHRRLAERPDFVLSTGCTYSGHPTACAAALANLEILERERLVSRADEIGRRFKAGLRVVAERRRLPEVRGVGGMWAAIMPEGLPADDIAERMFADGVITRPIGESVVAFCPPLTIGLADVDRCVSALDAAIEAALPAPAAPV